MNPRRGLRRIGMRSWQVDGLRGVYIIEREKRRRWNIRPASMDASWSYGHFHTLTEARSAAEYFAAALPACLDRRYQPVASSGKKIPTLAD